MRGLLQANLSIIGDLGLGTVLLRIVEAARELVDARYGALGVLALEGIGLEDFIHVGMDESAVVRIGHLPEGKDLLGLLIEDPRPIRLHDLGEHRRSVGFPEGHPPMKAFLGVPIRVRDEAFGNLYLTRTDDREFTPGDEELVLALAATAGVAIENARLFEESRRRQEWLQSSTDVTRRLLSESDDGPLRLIARSVLELADADLVAMVQRAEGESSLVVSVAEGPEAGKVLGVTYPVDNTISELVLHTGKPVRLPDAEDTHDFRERVLFLSAKVPVGPVMVLPLLGGQGIRGVLLVTRARARHPFTGTDLEMATAFANQASVAWELADARRDQQQVLLLEDRARIARDLHDHVIQQLFAVGLSVQGTASHVGGKDAAVLVRVVENLDDAIKQIRTSIFQLRPWSGGLRSVVLDVVTEVRPALGFDPRVAFEGPVDTVVVEEILNDVAAIVREALTNIARHADANRAELLLRATGSEFSIRIEDDGRGLGPVGHRSGLANMRRRAEVRHGSLLVTANDEGLGTLLEWTIPIP